jgi:hypothetical protein
MNILTPRPLMKTIIHIGYPKAASTWLQKSLFPAIEEYEMVPENVISQKLLKPGAFVFDGNLTRYELNNQYKRSRIISEERFLGSFNLGWNNGAYIRELAHRLLIVFPEATIIIFIRKQADIIASAYAQYIRDGGTISANNYLNTPPNFTFQNILKFSYEQLEYHRIISYYTSLFESRVKVFLFEEIASNLKSFLHRFRMEMDVDLNDALIDSTPRNTRYSRTILKLNRCSNIFTRNGSINKYYLIHLPGFHSASKKCWNIIYRSGIFGKSASTEAILGIDNFQRIESYYVESNHKLSDYVSKELLEKHDYI